MKIKQMTSVYFQNDYDAAVRQKKKCLALFLIATAIYLIGAATVLVVYLLEPYGSKLSTPLLVLQCVWLALYVVFAYIFMAIRFNRVRRYCTMVGDALTRKPTSGTATFMRFNSDISEREGVDCRSMTLVEWSEKEKEYMERYIMLDVEKAKPDFRAGDELSFKTYSNILVAYEVLNRTDMVGTPFENA